MQNHASSDNSSIVPNLHQPYNCFYHYHFCSATDDNHHIFAESDHFQTQPANHPYYWSSYHGPHIYKFFTESDNFSTPAVNHPNYRSSYNGPFSNYNHGHKIYTPHRSN